MKKHILTTTALLFAAFVSAQNVPTAEIQKEVDAHLQNLPFASFPSKFLLSELRFTTSRTQELWATA